ncbi:hypothetical protein FKP32DRAFT_1646107 [Trametes sanguinea]|nr:hypothetical protein FKP32DRAFT_1646107 [Trametes sanguinea]
MVMSLAKAQDATQSQSGSPAPDVEVGGISSEDIFALKKKMTLTLARAVRTIDLIPGFFVPRSDCKLSIAQHLETLVSTQESLRTARDSIDSAWREAKKLFEARDKLIRAHENILHRRAMVKAVRWASIITLPFMPFLSGVLSVVEMSMAVSNGVQESFVTDDELLSTTSGVNDLHDKLLEQIKKLDELRAELVPVIAKVTEQRDNPLSPQLLYLRAKLKSTTQIVEAAFHRRTAADHRSDADEDAPDSCRTLREAIQAMHAIMPMLGLSITRDVSLASVSDEAWQRIEAELVKYKVSATY